jgi:hypothetical protein
MIVIVENVVLHPVHSFCGHKKTTLLQRCLDQFKDYSLFKTISTSSNTISVP